MIEIKADSERNENVGETTVIVHIDADGKRAATKELYTILKALDKKCPEILMNAIELLLDDLSDEFFEEGGDND